MNALLNDGKVVLDGQEFKSAPPLCDYLAKKFPNSSVLKPYHVSRHKPHLPGFKQGMAMILRGNKLFRPSADGDLEEIRQFPPEEALKIIISIGLDALVHGRMKLGSKTLVDAIKIYADITANKEDPDEYDKMVADRHKGKVIELPKRPASTEEILDSVQMSEVPLDLQIPSFDQDDDEEGDDS